MSNQTSQSAQSVQSIQSIKTTTSNQNQDWKPVVLSKKKNPTNLTQTELVKQLKTGAVTREIKEKQGGSKNTQYVSDINARKLEENEIGRHQKPSHNLSTQIQQARNAKNLTQTQLNALCNFPKGTVANYENGSAIINSMELQAMSKHLGVILKKNA